MKKAFSIIFLGLLFLAFTPNLTQAAGLVPCGGKGEVPCQLCHFFVMFDNIIDFLLLPPPAGGGIVLGIAALMIAIGGFMYIFAYVGGVEKGPSMISQAKSLFTAVVIGLIIIYGAWSVLSTYFMFIGVANWTGLQDWWQIPCP